MPYLIDGESTVIEVRGNGREEQIADVTDLSVATIRAKLRDAHGRTKLRNLFTQWPERVEELGNWTAAFARERNVIREIAEITSLTQRVVTQRLEQARGNTLVQNVFGIEWWSESSPSIPTPTASAAPDPDSYSEGARLSGGDADAGRMDVDSEPTTPADIGPRSTNFRRYDLRVARGTHARREPAAHQTEALAKLSEWYRSRPEPHRGGVLALPTGGGKTFTTVRFLCQEPLSDGYKVLWLAHTHHLLEQALEAFGPVDGASNRPFEVAHIAETRDHLDVRVVSATPGHFPISTVSSSDDVVIATLQTIVAAFNRGHEKLTRFLDSSEGKLVVVFDEAHHAPAPSYRKLLERLREAHPRLYLLGLTATPTYNDERRQGWLKALFPQDVLATVSRSQLIAARILSKPHFENAQTGVAVAFGEADYQRWLSSFGDLPEHIVTMLANDQQRNDFIADAYIAGREKYGKTLVFADRWFQCDYLREALRKRGVRADVVYSHVDARLATSDERNRRSKDENSRVLEAFRSGDLDVLINVRMLTEGTDVPSVQSVFLTRQTTSSILLTQMIGRALRGTAFGGTADAYIVSFIDNWKQVISFADYEALPLGGIDDPPTEYGKRPPLQLISIELVRRLARQMYKGGSAATAPFLTLLPVGWYRVEFQTRAGAGDDVVWTRQLVMVFANEKGRYDAFIQALSESELTPYATELLGLGEVRAKLLPLQNQFFAATEEHPGTDLLLDLFHIARHMGQSDGAAPTFFGFEERSQHDIDAIAADCVRRDLGVRALEDTLRAEYGRVDRFWQSLYSNYGLFYTQYQASQRRILDAALHGHDADRFVVTTTPERVPLAEASEAVKGAVFRRDEGRCCCCGSTRQLQIDHVVPLYLGGTSDMEQLQTLCRVCNATKAINELNFRTTRTPLTVAPRFVALAFPVEHADEDDEAPYVAYVRRSINFFYRCAAVDTFEGPDASDCEVRLRPGIDASWIAPCVARIEQDVNEARKAAGLAPFGRLRVSATA